MVIEGLLDAVLVDIGGTIIAENPPSTSVDALVPQLLTNVTSDLVALSRSVRLGAAANTAVMSGSDVRRLLALVDIDRFFEVIVTSHDVGAAKPHRRAAQPRTGARQGARRAGARAASRPAPPSGRRGGAVFATQLLIAALRTREITGRVTPR